MTPKEFIDSTLDKSYDFDNYPPENKYQCIDYFQKLLIDLHIPVSIYCALTGYVCDLWRLREQYGYGQYFQYITDPKKLRNGDVVIWDRGSSHPKSHIAIYYDGFEVGQNQPLPKVTMKETTFGDMFGALRPKCWADQRKGYAEHFSKDFAHTYACAYPLHIRTGGDTSFPSLDVMAKGDRVTCYGYYHNEKGRLWLYVTYKNLTGFACYDYLTKLY